MLTLGHFSLHTNTLAVIPCSTCKPQVLAHLKYVFYAVFRTHLKIHNGEKSNRCSQPSQVPICHVKQASGLGNLTTASHALYFKYRKIRSASKSSVVLAPQYSRPLYHACSLLFTPLFADTVTRPIHHRWQIFLQQPVVTVRHSGANGQREGGEVWMRKGWAGGGRRRERFVWKGGSAGQTWG